MVCAESHRLLTCESPVVVTVLLAGTLGSAKCLNARRVMHSLCARS